MPEDYHLSKADEDEIKAIKIDYEGGLSHNDVENALWYFFKENKTVYVPSSSELIEPTSLEGYKKEGFTRLIFSMPFGTEHQVLASIDLTAGPPYEAFIVDSIGPAAASNYAPYLSKHFPEDILNVQVILSPFEQQNNQWSCGVYVMEHAKYFSKDPKKLEEKPERQQLDVDTALNDMYVNYVKNGRMLMPAEKLEEKEVSFQKKRNFIEMLGKELEKSIEGVEKIKRTQEFLQSELYGSLLVDNHEMPYQRKSHIRYRSPEVSAREYYRLTKDTAGTLLLLSAAAITTPLLARHINVIETFKDNAPLLNDNEQILLDKIVEKLQALFAKTDGLLGNLQQFLSCWDDYNENKILHNIINMLAIDHVDFPQGENLSILLSNILAATTQYADTYINEIEKKCLSSQYQSYSLTHQEMREKLRKEYPLASPVVLEYIANNDIYVQLVSQASIIEIVNQFPAEEQNIFLKNIAHVSENSFIKNRVYIDIYNFINLLNYVPNSQKDKFAEYIKNHRVLNEKNLLLLNLLSLDENKRENYILDHIDIIKTTVDLFDPSLLYDVIGSIPLHSNELQPEEKEFSSARNRVAQAFGKIIAGDHQLVVQIASLLPDIEKFNFIQANIEDLKTYEIPEFMRQTPGESLVESFEYYLNKCQNFHLDNLLTEILKTVVPEKMRVDFFEKACDIVLSKLSKEGKSINSIINLNKIVALIPAHEREEFYEKYKTQSWANYSGSIVKYFSKDKMLSIASDYLNVEMDDVKKTTWILAVMLSQMPQNLKKDFFLAHLALITSIESEKAKDQFLLLIANLPGDTLITYLENPGKSEKFITLALLSEMIPDILEKDRLAIINKYYPLLSSSTDTEDVRNMHIKRILTSLSLQDRVTFLITHGADHFILDNIDNNTLQAVLASIHDKTFTGAALLNVLFSKAIKDTPILAILLEAGISASQKNTDNLSLIELAIADNNTTAIRMMVEQAMPKTASNDAYFEHKEPTLPSATTKYYDSIARICKKNQLNYQKIAQHDEVFNSIYLALNNIHQANSMGASEQALSLVKGANYLIGKWLAQHDLPRKQSFIPRFFSDITKVTRSLKEIAATINKITVANAVEEKAPLPPLSDRL